MARFNVRLPVTGFIWALVEAEDERRAAEAALTRNGESVCVDNEKVVGLSVDCSKELEPLVIPVRTKPISKRAGWLNVLTDEQKEIRRQERYDEIGLTPEQEDILGDEGCCWITAPTFYANSGWCS
jgi:hypothetical protein